MNEEKKKVIKILRSLIISSPQRGKSIKELIREYGECEGKRLPTFEYRCLEDFLRASGEFVFENCRGELIVHEKPNSDSLHITKLVSEQNKPKRKISGGGFNVQRAPIRQPPLNVIRSSHPVPVTRSPRKAILHKNFGNNAGNQQRSSNKVPLHKRPESQSVEFRFDQLQAQAVLKNCIQNQSSDNTNINRSSSSNTVEVNRQNQQIQSIDLRNRLNELRNTTTSKAKEYQIKQQLYVDLTLDSSSSDSSPTKKSHHQYNNPTEVKTAPVTSFAQNRLRSQGSTNAAEHRLDANKITAPASAPVYSSNDDKKMTTEIVPNNPFFCASQPPSKLQSSISASKIQDRLKHPPKYDAADAHIIVNKSIGASNERKSSINDRLLLVRQNLQTIDIEKGGDVNQNLTTTQQEPLSPQIREPFQSRVPLNQERDEDDLDFLYKYCIQHKLGVPKFKIFKDLKNHFQCSVEIDNIRYSTYPTDYPNESEARLETAKCALKRLDANRNLLKYPVCLDGEAELAIKIYNCIINCSTGIFSKNISEKFQSSYKQSLPTDWMSLISKYPRFFTIENCINEKIVYVVEENIGEVHLEDQKMDDLKLPWEETYWSLIINSITSTVEVWGRLIGKEYSNALDSLIIDIELDLMSNKQLATEFNVGQIYLVLISTCIYRVRIEKVDHSRHQCLCFLIDEGDQKWFGMTEIYVCKKKFVKFPAQAIRFALYGLEDFAENAFARPHLETVLLHRSLIGLICTKREDYIRQDESDDLEAIIQVIFYDTTTDDDINLNPIIVEKICADVEPPQLLPSKLTPVYVSHIADNGDVFCQLQNNGVHYVNKLIHKLTQKDICVWQSNENSNKQLFLVLDEDTSKWCRGSLVNEGKNANTMFFIDYGKTKIVPLSKIYCLESLNQALLTYPPQAMQVKLDGINIITENLVSLLRGFFSAETLAYVKVQSNIFVPEVKLYLIKDSLITCINDSFELQKECIQFTEETAPSPLVRQISSSSIVKSEPDDLIPHISHLTLGSQKSYPILQKLTKFQPPKVGSFFEVEVVLTSNPGNFVIRANMHMQKWYDQMKKLQNYCNNNENTMRLNMIEVGEAYACLHSDRCWYRAIVKFNFHSKMIMFFCDLGEIDNIDDVKRLKFLPEEYRILPKLAVTAKLHGIRPVTRDWEMDDCIYFNRLTVKKKFQAFVKKITENENRDENSLLEIRLVDVSNEYDDCINDNFVSSNRALAIRL